MDRVLIILYLFYLISCCFIINSLNREVVFELVFLLLLYLILRKLSIGQLGSILFIFPIAATCQFVHYMIENYFFKYESLGKINGLFLNSTLWGGFVSVSLIISFGILLFCNKKPVLTILFIVVSFILLLAVIESNSRAAWLGCFIGLMLLLLKKISQSYTLQFSFKFKLLIVCLIISFTFFALSAVYHYKKGSADGRLLIWLVAMEMVKEKPLLGFGIGGFQKFYMNYQADFLKNSSDKELAYLADNTVYAFNDGLKILVEHGIIGILLLGSCLIVFFTTIKNFFIENVSYSTIISVACITAILIFSNFSYPSSSFHFLMLLCFLLAIISKENKGEERCNLTCSSLPKITLLLLFLLSTGVYFYQIIKYTKANDRWHIAVLTQKGNKGIVETLSLEPMLYNNPYYLLSVGIVFSKQKQYQSALSILTKASEKNSSYESVMELGKCYSTLGRDSDAINCFTRGHLMIPHKFTPEYLILKLYYKNGKWIDAFALSDSLLRKPVKINSTDLALIMLDIRGIHKKSENRIINN